MKHDPKGGDQTQCTSPVNTLLNDFDVSKDSEQNNFAVTVPVWKTSKP